MKTRTSFVLVGLALLFVLATPALGQDVVKEGEAPATEMSKSHNEMMGEGEGCQCSCMAKMHEKMMEMHGDAEGHAEGMAHGADEGHAEMMEAHMEMMAGCECMSGEMGEGEHAMSCKMHGEHDAKGEMEAEEQG